MEDLKNQILAAQAAIGPAVEALGKPEPFDERAVICPNCGETGGWDQDSGSCRFCRPGPDPQAPGDERDEE